MEVEIKYTLKNPKQVIKKLNELAIPEKNEEYQKDSYFKLGSKQLRIRESKSGNFLSHKEKIDNISCNSYCTKIRDVKSTIKILEKIGFKKDSLVEKTRSTWKYKNFEISIDKVKKLGYFIEIESNKKRDFLNILNLIGAEIGSQDFKGYPNLLL